MPHSDSVQDVALHYWDARVTALYGAGYCAGNTEFEVSMIREDIIRTAREIGIWRFVRPQRHEEMADMLEQFAKMIYEATFRDANIAASRTIIDAAVLHEREACAKVCEEKQEYSMPIPCPDGISGCLVAHYIPARREKTGSECAAAIRARSYT